MSNPNEIISPLKVRGRVQYYSVQSSPTEFDQSKWGATTGHLNAAVKQLDADGESVTDFNRRLVLAFVCLPETAVFEPLSSKVLTPQQKAGVYHWVGSQPDPVTLKWYPRKTFTAEANWILGVAQFFYSLIHASGRSGSERLSDLIRMYKVEAGLEENLVGADYWLAAALSLPGGVFTGQVEDVEVIDRSLSGSEILELQRERVTQPTPERDEADDWLMKF